MIYRLIFVASIILLSFPFVGVPTVWLRWTAFGLGVLFFIYSIYSVIRHASEDAGKKADGEYNKKEE